MKTSNKIIPFYTLELPESAKEEIREIYGRRKVSENIINMYHEHLKYRMLRSRSIYDYEVMGSTWFYEEVKDRSISQPDELTRWLEVRTFRNGTEFKKKEAKHYRFKPDFLRKHGLVIKKIYVPLKVWDKGHYSPSPIEKGTNYNIDRIEIDLNLWSMTNTDIERELMGASYDRFARKTNVKGDKVECWHKRYDFELSYQSNDHALYKYWETKVGAYRKYNSLVKFKYGDRLAEINPTNNRLDHRLLELPKECLRYIRVDGEPLVENDLKNSQPCLLMNVLFGNLQVPFKDYGIILDQVRKEYDNLVELVGTNPKLHELIESTYSGTFYEVLQRLSSESMTRDEAKKATMFVLFSEFKPKWNPSVQMWVDNHPELYWFIQNFKKGYFKAHKDNILSQKVFRVKKSDKSAYEASTSFLPVLLQKIEAMIFLDHILIDLYHKGIFALSKHDAILCKRSDSVKVKRIMEQHLSKLLGENRYTLDTTQICTECHKLAA